MPRKVIEDDDEAGQDEYENDVFIVNEVDEEEHEKGGANNDVERLKKKRRRKTESQKNYVLDEDDYELIKDNNITGFHRPEKSKKLKRLRKAQRDEFDRTGIVGRTAEEMFQHSLFGDDEEQQEDEDANIGDEDDLADFIVEEEEIDDHGSPASMKVNKKLSKKAAGSHVVFGDIDDPFNRRKQGLTKMSVYDDESIRRMERRIKDEFGPTIPSDKYMPEKDDMIQHTDIPERIQIFEQSIGPLPTDECSIDEEGIWICKQLTNMTHLYGRNIEKAEVVHELSIAKDDVIRFLDLMHIQKLDVPFIAMYRKDECSSLFKDPYKLEADEFNDSSNREPALIWHKILWTILELDRKWLLLKKRKSALQLNYNKIYVEESRILNDEARLNLIKQLFDSISKSLKAAESEREVDDVDSKFSLHFPPGEVGDVDGRYKRPKRKSQYSICSKAGLGEVASKFGYSSEQFGLQISLGKMRMEELLDREETPEELVANYICALFGTPQDVLRGARHMAAAEISCEPNVCKHVRSIFMNNAVVSTSPTPDGNVAIKTFHQYATVKWLREKPLTKFVDAQWLLIQKAEDEKLIRVTIELPGSVMDKLTNDFNENYLSGGACKSALSWNEQRKQILQDALFSFLLPSMEKEARLLLTSRAKSWLIWEYGKLLWDKVSVGPYKRDEQDLKSDEEAAPRVMACCWGFGKTATTFVMLDSFGEVLDVLPTRSLSNRSQNVNDQQRKKNDQQRVLKFMSDHQPHVIVLGAANVSCTRLKEDIYEIISKTAEDNPRAFGKEMNGISILYGDEALPLLYENSRISSDQLPLQSGIVKRAVALGRYLQNPLAMVATLCGLGKEILSWKLSPLEDFLTSDEKYSMIEQVLVDVTNQVGLDINLAASHDWLFSTMQFISGLGPRKAASLMRSLVRTGATFTRKELTTHGLGRKVFINTVGFLRVRRIGMAAASSQYIDMLDDTRIHPESYGLAQGLAKDIYIQDIQEDRNDDEVLEMAIEHVKEKPNLLKSLEVREYAESKQLGNKIETINLIRSELIHGFRDWRRQYAEPSQDEEFCMISGESEDHAEGRIVQATVRRVQPQRAICALDSGLTGMLSKEDYADDCCEDTDLTEKLREGDVVTCKIKSIQKDRYQLFLSCKESEMRNNQYQNHQNIDPYYQEDLKNLPVDQERMIVHPRFQNITADEAIEGKSFPTAAPPSPIRKQVDPPELTLGVINRVRGRQVTPIYLLFECASGYALFHARGISEVDMQKFEAVEEYINSSDQPLELKAFQPFSSDEDALAQLNAVSNSIVTNKLKEFLEYSLPPPCKNSYAIATSDSVLGGMILRKTGMDCRSAVLIEDVMRGLREKIDKLIGLEPRELENAQLKLARLYNNQAEMDITSSSSLPEQVSVVPHRFEGVFNAKGEENMLCTRNLVPGEALYGEKLIHVQNEDRTEVEYRVWDPLRSKLGAAILGGVTNIWIKPGSRVLYVGNVCGLTVSDLSDLVGSEGLVYVVGFFDGVVGMAGNRPNVVAFTEKHCDHWQYRMLVGMVDLIFAEIDHRPDQVDILTAANFIVNNAHFYLRAGGHYMISTQANDIDPTCQVEDLCTRRDKRKEFRPIETLNLLEGAYALAIGGYRI